MAKENKDKWEALATVKSFDFGITSEIQNDSAIQASSQQIEIIHPPVTTPISLLVQSLVQQLCSLLENDPKRADQLYKTICEKLHSMNLLDNSYAMGEFEVMRSQYQRALYQLVAVANGSELPIQLPVTWPIVKPSGLEWSRYHREFEELYFIAGGGFGSVFKAKHRLDGVEYAVKKVFIKSSDVDSIMSHLSEVKTIASLNHPNIVSYKAAWLEPMIESTLTKKKNKFKMDLDSDDFTDINTNMSAAYPDIIKTFKTYNSKELTKEKSHSDFIVSFKNSSQDDSDSSIIFEDSNSEDETSPPSCENALCKWFEHRDYENCSRVNLKWATLYIQMSFCQQTLKQWLDERNNQLELSRKSSTDLGLQHSESIDLATLPVDPKYPSSWSHVDVVVDMFSALVRGLQYIHSRGVVHHDVKPSNVFVGSGVQLGDFGLACPLSRPHRRLAAGTPLYAAPEQLAGECDPKSDMYSLGVVLLEMVLPFGTDMERVKTLSDLRKGHIPAQLTASHPKIAHIIGKLVQRRPSRRLDCHQLLEELRGLREDQAETVRALREELAAKDDEIARLKMMLAKMNNGS